MPVSGNLYTQTERGPRLTPRGRAISLLAVLMLVGVALGAFNVPLASSAANAVAVKHSTTAVAIDPMSPAWDQVEESQVPLSSQQIYQPGGGTTRAVRVRAMEDGQNIAFRLSWDDDSRNDTLGNIPSDAAAIQLPINPSHLPYQCMGQSNSRVNIWQWKAALEREGVTNMGAMPQENPGVRNLTSNGICKAVDTPGMDPQVKSFHDGKQWHIVFYRKLAAANPGSAPLIAGTNSSIAFGIWNGARGEVRGMKAVSTWNALTFPTVEQSATGGLLALGIVVVLSAAGVAWTMRRFAS